MKNRTLVIYLTLASLLISCKTIAQIGSDHIYSFINLPLSSRISALGGNPTALNDSDNSIALLNPSLNKAENDKMLSMSFIDYFGDITAGNAIFSKSFNEYGNFNLGIQYIDYGNFTETDETGEQYGDFSANENAITLGWGRMLSKSFSIGANIKTITSNYYHSNSWGLASDLAGSYFNKDKSFTASLLLRNMGRQVKSYGEEKEAIPFEMLIGISKKLKHVPFRYTLTYAHLEQFDLTYNESNESQTVNNLNSESNNSSNSKIEDFADQFMRHIILGGEFAPSKNIAFRFGYNYRRRQELKVETKKALAGFAGGVEIKISKFRIGYSRASYHIAGALNQFTLSTNFSEFAPKNHDVMD